MPLRDIPPRRSYSWLIPYRKLAQIIHAQPHVYFLLLPVFSLLMTLALSDLKYLHKQEPLLSVMFIACCTAVGASIIALYALMVSWTGTWIGGNDIPKTILLILAFCLVPAIIALGLYNGRTWVGGELEPGGGHTYILIATWLMKALITIFSLWSLLLFTAGLALLQRFTMSKALLNIILPFMVVSIPLGFLVLVFTI